MNHARTILGLIAGALMAVSSAAHSLLGWKALSGALTAAQAPADLIQALELGWHFGGIAMLAFGCIVVAVFWRRRKGVPVSLMPAIVIGTTYVVFGLGAFVASGYDPFFMIFVVPGLFVLIASLPRRAAA
jgi:hypothetical protein